MTKQKFNLITVAERSRSMVAVAICLAGMTIFAGCGGKCDKTDPTSKCYEKPDVYVAGYERNASGYDVATLWKNGTAQKLTNGEGYAKILNNNVRNNNKKYWQ